MMNYDVCIATGCTSNKYKNDVVESYDKIPYLICLIAIQQCLLVMWNGIMQ